MPRGLGRVLPLASAKGGQRAFIQHLDTAVAMQTYHTAPPEDRNGAAHGFQRQAKEFANIGTGCGQVEDRALMVAAALRIHK